MKNDWNNTTSAAALQKKFSDLSFNKLTYIHQGTMHGLTDQLRYL